MGLLNPLRGVVVAVDEGAAVPALALPVVPDFPGAATTDNDIAVQAAMTRQSTGWVIFVVMCERTDFMFCGVFIFVLVLVLFGLRRLRTARNPQNGP
jgi:hypothetical protein